MNAPRIPMPGDRSLPGTYMRMFAATSIWAITFHVGYYASHHADPLGVAFLRFLVAGITLALIARLRGQSLRVTRKQLPLIFSLAIPGVVAYTLFFLASVQTISGSRAALITAGSPVLVELAAIVLLGAAASAMRWTGIVLALLGTAVVLTGGNLLSAATTVGRGELYALGCMVGWSMHVFMSRRIVPVGLNSLVATTWSVLVGAALLAVPLALSDNPARLLHYPAGVWASVLHMAWLATALSFIWFADGVRMVGPTRASVFTNVVPVMAVLFGVLALGEHLHWSMFAGGALVVAGVWLTNRAGASAPAPAPAPTPSAACSGRSCHA